MRIGGSLLVAALVLTVLTQASGVGATVLQMRGLPSYGGQGCRICHTGVGVSEVSAGLQPTANLNAFARAWIANGKVWDEVLAHGNADNDGCTNGFELRDPDGSWRAGQDQRAPTVDRNPGDPFDCPLPLDEKSWGVLKGLFGA